MNLYPLKFRPIFKQTIWGGNKLREQLHKTLAPENTGESWELSAVAGNVSIAKNGPLAGKDLDFLCKHFGPQLLGEKVCAKTGNDFPLLFKFIDAAKDLSIQVHPADELARARHNCLGKTEMWYVLQADPGARLLSGFQESTAKEEYPSLVQSGEIINRLGCYEVKAGDVFFIPAGRIHAIGAGLVVAEVQQTSDVTYRIYDYHRKGPDGKERQLHTEQALDAIDFSVITEARNRYIARLNQAVPAVQCPFFTVNVLELQGHMHRDLKAQQSFVVYMCAKGQAQLECGGYTLPLQTGETVLVPAQCADCILSAEQAKLLEVYI